MNFIFPSSGGTLPQSLGTTDSPAFGGLSSGVNDFAITDAHGDIGFFPLSYVGFDGIGNSGIAWIKNDGSASFAGGLASIDAAGNLTATNFTGGGGGGGGGDPLYLQSGALSFGDATGTQAYIDADGSSSFSGGTSFVGGTFTLFNVSTSVMGNLGGSGLNGTLNLLDSVNASNIQLNGAPGVAIFGTGAISLGSNDGTAASIDAGGHANFASVDVGFVSINADGTATFGDPMAYPFNIGTSAQPAGSGYDNTVGIYYGNQYSTSGTSITIGGNFGTAAWIDSDGSASFASGGGHLYSFNSGVPITELDLGGLANSSSGVISLQDPSNNVLIYLNGIDGSASFANGDVSLFQSSGGHGGIAVGSIVTGPAIVLDPLGTGELDFYNNGFITAYITCTDGSGNFPGGVNIISTAGLITSAAPPAANAAGTTGSMIFADDYTYRCFDNGDWRRVAVSYVTY